MVFEFCAVLQDMSVVVADFGLARITSEMSLQDRSRASKRGRRIERKKRFVILFRLMMYG